MADDIVLKILSGPHLGAEAALKEGVDYVLGSGQDSDLTLADTTMAEKHFSVRVNQDKITFKPLDGQVFQDGLIMPPGENNVTPYTLLKAGNTRFSLGAEDGPWPDPAKLESKRVASPFLSLDSDIEPPSAVSEVPQVQPEPQPGQAVLDWLNVHKNMTLIFLVAIIVVFMAVVAFQRLERPLSRFEQRQLSQSLLKRGGFRSLMTDINKNGTVIISGRISSKQRLHKLHRIFSGVGYPVKIEVMLTATVAKQLRHWMKKHSIPLQVSVTEAGELIISGYARTQEIYDGMLREVRTAIPHLGHIESKIVTYKQVVPELASLLGSEDLWDKVSLKSEDFDLTGTVELKPGNTKKWAGLVARMDNIFEISIPFDVKVVTPEEIKTETAAYKGGPDDRLPEDEELFDSGFGWETVQSVLLDQSPKGYIDDSNRVFSVGDETPGGYRVTEVTRMGVVLMRDNDMLFLPTKEY